MTHLSDFSYLQRDVQEIYLTSFLMIRMWQADGFRCLSPKRLINGELRSIITWFMFLLLIAQSSWDLLCTYIKYTEGFMQVAPGIIISKPFSQWSPKNQDPIAVMNYIQCITFSLQVSILLLLQCFWNYLSNTVAKHSFMSSKEFSLYIIFTIGSMAMFPVLQYFYKKTALEEVVPQTAYSCEILCVALLGFRNHGRFNRLIKVATGNGKRSDVHVSDKLAYFRDMNLLLSVALVAFGGGIFILCIDGFTANKVINSHKFAADLLICNANISSIFIWLIIIGIFHPARVAIEPRSINNTSTKETPARQPFKRTSKTQSLSTPVPLSPIVSPPSYIHTNNNNNQAYYMDSGKNKDMVDTKQGYMSSSPSDTISTTATPIVGGGLNHPQHHQQRHRFNIVSIDDPYATEPVTFSMVNSVPNSKGNTVSYASAVDYYGVNDNQTSPSISSYGFRSMPASPPPDQDLPPVPTNANPTSLQSSTHQQHSDLHSNVNSSHQQHPQDLDIGWLERSH
ncbi:uncharacterized protein BX664DRAFT_339512 [Halteromyces radiatus]|uniref:uncharacterized protein n=1 Tax=Halteromyces radiatus TaxID=101107 RepID=UPI002220E21A|nr:uncharacterized protein BX664DRAFT_339512 [Halteromyces radiatus]KAI8082967.1 hypothetical protein BX664DRAFT_339512 [Halteromyces radiatus]